ncbi:MAG: hypothetical protein JXQ74_00260 [Alphaproteobacteria bacterium]|nr:hypothetical protein [Alphaproteobacteria bacterium]
MPAKTTKKAGSKLSATKAKKTVKKVKDDLVKAEKRAEKTVKKAVDSAKKLPKTVKGYSAKKAKVDIRTLILEARDLLLRPRQLFESIKVNNDFDEPIIKAAVYGFLGALVSTVLGLLGGQGLASLTKLISVPMVAVLMTFGLAGILLLISYIANGRMDFEASVKAVSSKIFIYPLAIVLAAVSLTYPLLVFTTVLIDVFVLYLAYSMVVYCLNADLKRARVLFAVLAVLMVLFYFTGYSTAWFMTRNFEVAMEHHLQQTLGMQIDMDSLKNLIQ